MFESYQMICGREFRCGLANPKDLTSAPKGEFATTEEKYLADDDDFGGNGSGQQEREDQMNCLVPNQLNSSQLYYHHSSIRGWGILT